ncbi:MAG: hypothetical protein DI538_23595 [Azospira oryzae]|jgi:hypothetical protein|nr:MAG: hypothetical protein DI538_23595 [Azospira oryzae]
MFGIEQVPDYLIYPYSENVNCTLPASMVSIMQSLFFFILSNTCSVHENFAADQPQRQRGKA